MPVITKIEKQKKFGQGINRVNIYLDGKFGFGLDLESLMTENLKEGMELSEDRIKEIIKKAEFNKISEKLIHFASLRPRSTKEINDWFYKYKTSETIQDDLIRKLERLGFYNDLEFAKWWIEQRLQFKSKSKRELQKELTIKGIDKKIIEEVLGEGQINEEKPIKKLLEKNDYKWRGLGSFQKKQKMMAFLGRKGFSWETIKKVIGEDFQIDE